MASHPSKFRPIAFVARSLLTLAIFAGIGWGGRALWLKFGRGLFGTQRESKIPTTRVKPANISEEIIAVGRLRAVFSTELRAEISGRITKISVKDGETIKRAQEILKLDQQDILTQLQESERNIEASKLKMGRAKREFERQTDLKQNGLVTLKDFEETRTLLSLAENEAAVYDARAANLRDFPRPSSPPPTTAPSYSAISPRASSSPAPPPPAAGPCSVRSPTFPP
jgi:multidrug efflux pump subunit AcrA (membrane-fusion protein)